MKRTIDVYLENHGETRENLAMLSGFSLEQLDKAINMPLNNVTLSLLRSLGMLTRKYSYEVLKELEAYEAQSDPLLGFRDLLVKNKVTYPLLELKLKLLIDQANSRGIEIQPFTFNRFESEEHENEKEAVKTAMENAIKQLTDLIEPFDE